MPPFTFDTSSPIRRREWPLPRCFAGSDEALVRTTLPLEEVELPPGRILHESGEPFDFVYWLHSGLVSLLLVMPDGSTVGAALIGADGVVDGSAALGSEIALRRASVHLPVRATRVPVAPLFAFAAEHAEVRRWLVRYNDALIARIQQSVACNALHDVQTRLCGWLSSARDHARTDVLPVTQEFLSQLLGVRRTTITLLARQLRSAGVISYSRGIVTITDPDALERLACCCRAMVREQTVHLLGDEAPPELVLDPALTPSETPGGLPIRRS
ncbi:cyclic nucleotide-binding domain (cNMP-BD) protein [Rhodovulum sp. PH10]|uniref:Crp/Fnr family transcriptional regulator n=1 Tax=Rhodovulum sp. PH10 TaxID=1187851 RepID=UPI00027C29BA|nr:Crp/Fnr family transcriptional regulator [Rhodovulum sp. PH10]EJW13310.1 cyclic nucleotide-binding domain (cNMP-BD) protein [Rhodovulum sp. PH10]